MTWHSEDGTADLDMRTACGHSCGTQNYYPEPRPEGGKTQRKGKPLFICNFVA